MHPFRIAGVVLGILALFFIGFLVLGFLLPSGWEAEREVTLEAPAEEVYPWVARPAGWAAWTPSPEAGLEAFGPEEGVGAGHRWDDASYGEGSFRIVDVRPGSEVRYEVEVEGGAIRIEGTIRLDPTAGGTRLNWREVGDFGWNPLLGYLAGRMNELQGAQMEASLATLRSLVEGVPATSAPD